MKNKSLIIAGSVLTGVGSALTLSTGLAYYFKYKQGKLTDSEWFKSFAAASAAFTAASTAAVTDVDDTLALAIAADSAAAASAAPGVGAALAATTTTSIPAALNSNNKYKELSLVDTINFYKYSITYSSTFIENLDATNTAFAGLISSEKAFEAASKKERDTIYALVSLFGAVGPAIVIAGVPTLVTGLVRSNKDKNKLIKN
jgi:hypothetical protein